MAGFFAKLFGGKHGAAPPEPAPAIDLPRFSRPKHEKVNYERLYDAVVAHPGKTEPELALIVHGRRIQQLVNQDSRILESDGRIRFEGRPRRLYAVTKSGK